MRRRRVGEDMPRRKKRPKKSQSMSAMSVEELSIWAEKAVHSFTRKYFNFESICFVVIAIICPVLGAAIFVHSYQSYDSSYAKLLGTIYLPAIMALVLMSLLHQWIGDKRGGKGLSKASRKAISFLTLWVTRLLTVVTVLMPMVLLGVVVLQPTDFDSPDTDYTIIVLIFVNASLWAVSTYPMLTLAYLGRVKLTGILKLIFERNGTSHTKNSKS
ncbi:uncharacterized protein LOC144447823 [Glandiceps talaboti]